MRKQNGAALIVVLSLLTVSLMLGLSSMQSSQIDERLAGNYRNASQAQMGAERAATEALAVLNSKTGKLESRVDWQDCIDGVECLDEIIWENLDIVGDQLLSSDSYAFVLGEMISGTHDAPGYYIYAKGEILSPGEDGEVVSSSIPIAVKVMPKYIPGLANLSPLTVVSRIFNFKSGNSSNFGISRVGDGNVGTAIAVSDSGDVQTVMDGIPDNREANYATDAEGNIVTEQYFDVFSDPLQLQKFVGAIKDDAETSSELGVVGDPKITYIDGDYIMEKGDEAGAGILVVNGDFSWNGNNDYEGLVIVLGQSFKYNGGGSGSMIGSLLHASVTEDENGEWAYGIAEADASEIDSDIDISGGGGSIIQHDVNVLNSVAALLPSEAADLFPKDTNSSTESGFIVSSWD